MASLRLNFASKRWWTRPSMLVSIAALAGCVHALWWRADLLQRRESEVERSRRADRLAGPREHSVAVPLSHALKHVFEEMRYPWNEVLDSLQRAVRPGVDVLELAPDHDDVRRIRVQGVADEIQNVFDLLASLQDDPSWSSVQLLSQSKSNEAVMPQNNGSSLPPLPATSSRRIAFSLIAQWKRS